MAEACVKLGCPEVIRLALLDVCTGAAIPGPTNGAVLRCTRNASLTPQVRDVEESNFTSDCGYDDIYIQEAQRTGYELSFEVSTFSPQTEALLTGSTILANGADNVGVYYAANQGCTAPDPEPHFVAEIFFKNRGQCGDSITNRYIRYVIPNIVFNPAEIDKEGQITFTRFTGRSRPSYTDGLIDGVDGPFDDFPAGIVTSLGAFTAEDQTHGLWFADPITNPGLTLTTGTCYTTAVPAGS